MRPEDELRLADRLRDCGCVYAEEEARMLLAAADSPADLEELVRRRCAGEPLEHVVGWAEFCGRRVKVSPGVFVPRRRSELLARCAVELARSADERAAASGGRACVLDMCCGSGALALTVASEAPGIRLAAVDTSPEAVACAAANLAAFECEVLCGDLFAPLPASAKGGFDVIVANTPYVPSDEIDLLPAEARCFEPRSTLDGGPDGLALQRRLFEDSREWLRTGGHVAVETSDRQLPASESIAVGLGYCVTVRRDDRLGATVVVARLPEGW
jgi:release factor glutamine methyltransferase